MPPQGGEATDERRSEKPGHETQVSISAADELLSTEWHALMSAALDDLATIARAISP